MNAFDRNLRATLLLIVLLLGVVVLQLVFRPAVKASADSGAFDSITIVSVGFLFQGNQGVLLLDKRNGNLWFIGRGNDKGIPFKDPVFLARLPLDKLDQAPR